MGKIYNTEETTKTKNVSISDDLLISIVNGEKNKPILFRDELVSRIVTLFNKKEHRAILLVGNYGIGKNTIIKSLARQIKIFKMSIIIILLEIVITIMLDKYSKIIIIVAVGISKIKMISRLKK